MCGLYGFLDQKRPITALPESLLRRMSAALGARGRDDRGEIVLGHAVLGHHRLAIRDIGPGGHQPLTSPDGEILVVVNGEIWNHAELTADAAPGTLPDGRSDARAIFAAYRRAGPDFPRLLDGMFAIALYDRRLDRLILARDAFGEKPLFVRRRDGALTFASTLAALLDADDRVDRGEAWRFLIHGACPEKKALVRGIESLSPGHVLTSTSGFIEEHAWFSPRTEPTAGTSDALDLDRAIARRLEADVPIGVFLSGGIDAATILEGATKKLGRGVYAITAGFADPTLDERPLAQKTAAMLGARHEDIVVPDPTPETIDAMIAECGEPFADASAIALRALVSAARPSIKVALTGDGGDELFLGYDRYAAIAAAERPAARSLMRFVLPFLGGRRREKMLALIGGDETSAARRLLRLQAHASFSFFDDAFGSDAKAALESERLRYDGIDAAYRGRSTAQRMMLIDRETTLVDDLLVKSDRIATAGGIETRAPFLDRDLFLAMSMRMRRDPRFPAFGKMSLKKRMKGRLPIEVLRAKKRGFGVPLARYLSRGDLADSVRATLRAPSAHTRSLVSAEVIENLIRALDHGRGLSAELVYALYVLERWIVVNGVSGFADR